MLIFITGREFTPKEISSYLKRKNASIFCNIAKGPGILDRAVRSIRSKSVAFNKIDKYSPLESFLKAKDLFNLTQKRTLNNKSPLQVLKDGFVENDIKSLSSNQISYFSYKTNKKKIDKKMEKAIKVLPIFQPVLFSTDSIKLKRGQNFVKKSSNPAWSEKVYLIFKAKREY